MIHTYINYLYLIIAFFTTKIFHPNVSKSGEICVNTLKKDWKPDHTLLSILLTIKCLLIVPNPESALNEEAGRLMLEDWDGYTGQAKMYTKVYAMGSGIEFVKDVDGDKEGDGKHDTTSTSATSPKKRTASTTTATTGMKSDKKRILKRL